MRGPIVTTQSKFDTAVGRFYPLGARVRQQLVLGNGQSAEYGGIGTFGIQGAAEAEDLAMGEVTYAYGFKPAARLQPRGERIIKDGGGASGAHSDIAHPEVAHAFWAAVLASIDGPPGSWAANRNPRPLPPRQATPFAADWAARRGARLAASATSPPTRSRPVRVPRPRRPRRRQRRSWYRVAISVGKAEWRSGCEPDRDIATAAVGHGSAMGQCRARGPGRRDHPAGDGHAGTRSPFDVDVDQQADALTAGTFFRRE